MVWDSATVEVQSTNTTFTVTHFLFILTSTEKWTVLLSAVG